MGHARCQNCPCGAERQTAEHLFHDCPLDQCASIRREYTEAINRVNGEINYDAKHEEPLKVKAFRSATIMPDTVEIQDAIKHNPGKMRLNPCVNLKGWKI